MAVQRFTLIADGTSDEFLLPIIHWTLVCVGVHANAQFADPRKLPKNLTLAERLVHAADRFPCEVLFVHRDAEAQPLEARLSEVRKAFVEAKRSGFNLPAVALIPAGSAVLSSIRGRNSRCRRCRVAKRSLPA